MSGNKKSRLRFNLGFLLESDLGTKREIELSYPSVRVGQDVTLSPLQGRFEVTHTSKGLYVHGRLESTINTSCTRCLREVYLPILLELDDLYYHPPSSAPEGEYSIGENGILDLSPLLRELGLLAIPMQVYCIEDCRGICAECGQNLNEGTCDCEQDQFDPRLQALRKLMDS